MFSTAGILMQTFLPVLSKQVYYTIFILHILFYFWLLRPKENSAYLSLVVEYLLKNNNNNNISN